VKKAVLICDYYACSGYIFFHFFFVFFPLFFFIFLSVPLIMLLFCLELGTFEDKELATITHVFQPELVTFKACFLLREGDLTLKNTFQVEN